MMVSKTHFGFIVSYFTIVKTQNYTSYCKMIRDIFVSLVEIIKYMGGSNCSDDYMGRSNEIYFILLASCLL